MKTWQRIQFLSAFLAVWAFVFPTAILNAQEPLSGQDSRLRIQDIELSPEGDLNGRLVSASGLAMGQSLVVLRHGTSALARATTADDGTFTFNRMKGGIYNLSSSGNVSHVRVWSHQTAPPRSSNGILMVAGNVARAQNCTADSCTGTCGGTCDACGVGGGPLALLMNPFVIGAAVAAAIAIPLALDDDDAS